MTAGGEFEPARPLPGAAFERAGPLPAAGTATGEGAEGATWWSRRFIALLESFGVGSRLERGRGYARGGHVTELEVEPGIVLAKVQGTRYTPYRVRIRAKLLSEHQWRRAERAMAARALPLAQLLAGQMPPDIEELFNASKLTLLPSEYGDLKASCTCPDEQSPCKHIAAVYYVLAERFDTDPFLIFTWRGRTQDELVEALRARRRGSRRKAPRPPARAAPAAEAVGSFWDCGPALEELCVSPLAAEAPDALLRQLGPAPVDAGERDVTVALAGMYQQLAAAAERRALGE